MAMNAAVERVGRDETAVRSFRVDVPDSELAELRRRIKATRLPEKEPVADLSQGVPLATIEKLARYWADEYDWRKVEAQHQCRPEFHHRDRRPGHPLHPCAFEARKCAADHRHARLAVLGRRAARDHRAADRSDCAWRHGGRRLPRRDPVDSRLRIFRKAGLDRLGPGPHRSRLGGVDEAPGLHALRRAGRRLGRDRHGADGGAGAARD